MIEFHQAQMAELEHQNSFFIELHFYKNVQNETLILS